MHRYQKGVSLIEVLVSLTLLSFVLFGLSGTQITAMRAAKANYFAVVAMHQLEGMAALLQSLGTYDYQAVLSDWKKRTAVILPQGQAACLGRYPNANLTIAWGQQRIETCIKDKIGRHGCLRFP